MRGLVRSLARPARRLLRRVGYDVVSANSIACPDVRTHWIGALGIDFLVDVGANKGQFVGWMRARGYRGPIVSFEPLAATFEACAANLRRDPAWTGICCALGETEGETDMHVAGNFMSSSILPMLETHVDALPESAIIATERVRIGRLDGELAPYAKAASRIFLKIDTQGFEVPVLRGAGAILERVAFLELELSLVPLYAGQELMPAVCSEVAALGFTPVWMEPGFSNPAGARMLQMDGLFVKTELLP